MLNKLEQIRISKGIDKKFLCEKAGITRANYDHALRRNDIKISKFFALCEVLGVTLTIKIKDNDNDNEDLPAFPLQIDRVGFVKEFDGLTKREYFAAKIMASLMGVANMNGDWTIDIKSAVEQSINAADWLLKELEKPQQ